MIARETLLRPEGRSEDEEVEPVYRHEKEEKGRVSAGEEMCSKHVRFCDLCGTAGMLQQYVRAICLQRLAVAMARYEVRP